MSARPGWSRQLRTALSSFKISCCCIASLLCPSLSYDASAVKLKSVSLSGPSTAAVLDLLFIHPHKKKNTEGLISKKPGKLTPSQNFVIPQFVSSFSFSTHCRQLPSSSFPHPGQTALSVCVPAFRGGPGIWPRSGPGKLIHPLSALLPCNVGVHISCGRHWSFWGEEKIRCQPVS